MRATDRWVGVAACLVVRIDCSCSKDKRESAPGRLGQGGCLECRGRLRPRRTRERVSGRLADGRAVAGRGRPRRGHGAAQGRAADPATPLRSVGVLVATLFVTNSDDPAPWSRCRHVCQAAVLWGTAGGAVAGFAALVGPIGLLVAALMAATSPGAVRACRRGLHSVPRPSEAQLDALTRSLAYTNPMFVPFELTFDLRLFTDDQLCNAWRNSETAVSSPSTPRALLRAVGERGRYLDEFERRQPSLLRAWLATDSGAPNSPLPYADCVSPRSRPPSTGISSPVVRRTTDDHTRPDLRGAGPEPVAGQPHPTPPARRHIVRAWSPREFGA